MRWRMASAGQGDFRSRGRARGCRPLSAGVSPKMVSASWVRPEPTRPASPRISPARTSTETPRMPAAREVRLRSSSATSPMGTARLGKMASISRPTIMRIELRAREALGVASGDGFAVAQHGDAVGDRGNFLEAVRDINDAGAFGAARRRRPGRGARLRDR